MSDTTTPPPQFTSALGDPFDPAGVSNLHQPGMLGISPDVWRSLANFGSNMATSANARTPGGFLANGTGFAGPFAAAVGESNQQGLERGQVLSNMALQRAHAQNLQFQNYMNALQIPLLQAKQNMQMQFLQNPQQFMQQYGLNGPTFGEGASQQADKGDQSNGVPFAANNPLNMRYVGQDGATNTKGFAAFPTPEAGKAATDSLFDRYAQSGVNSLRGLISKWAPPSENNTDAYIAHVAKQTGIDPDQQIDLTSPAVKAVVQHSMAGFEGNKNANVPQAFQVAQAGNGPVPAPSNAVGNLGLVRLPNGNVGTPSPQQQAQAAPAPMQMQQTMAQPGQAQALAAQWQARAQRALQQANTLETMHSMGIPVVGDPQSLRQQAQTFTEKALQLQSVAPTEATKAAIELQNAGPLALAKAQNSNLDMREGAMSGIAQGNGQYTWIKNPKLERIKNPQTGQEDYVHISPAMPGSPEGTPGTAEPVLNAAGQPAVAEMPVAQQHFQEKRGTGLAEQFQQVDEQATAAKDSNYLFDNMRADSQTWDMNKFAGWEGDARAYMKAIANSFGIATPQMDQKISDFTAFSKSSGMLLRSAVHETSSRAAVQEYKMIGDTLPNPTSTKEAFEQISAQWQGLNDFRLAKQQFAHNYTGKPDDFNVDFNSSISPTSFMLNRLSQTPEGQQTLQGMLGRMQQNPEGRLVAKRMLQQYQYAKSNGYFNDLPPMGAGQ